MSPAGNCTVRFCSCGGVSTACLLTVPVTWLVLDAWIGAVTLTGPETVARSRNVNVDWLEIAPACASAPTFVPVAPRLETGALTTERSSKRSEPFAASTKAPTVPPRGTTMLRTAVRAPALSAEVLVVTSGGGSPRLQAVSNATTTTHSRFPTNTSLFTSNDLNKDLNAKCPTVGWRIQSADKTPSAPVRGRARHVQGRWIVTRLRPPCFD